MAVKGELEVQLIDTRHLQSADGITERMDPYVIIHFGGENRKSKVLRGGGSSPVWNETFRFEAEHPPSKDQYNLILKVMDMDTFSADDFVGSAKINVGDLIDYGAELGYAELPPQRYRIVVEDLTYLGSIRVGVTFRRKPAI